MELHKGPSLHSGTHPSYLSHPSDSENRQTDLSLIFALAARRGVSFSVVNGRLELAGASVDVNAVRPHIVAHRNRIVESLQLQRTPEVPDARSATKSASPAANPVEPVGGSGGDGARTSTRLAALLDIADAIQRDRNKGLTAAQIDAVWWLGELADAGNVIDLATGILVDDDDIAWPIRRAIDALAAGPPPNQSNNSAAANVWLDRVTRFHAAWISASWRAMPDEYVAAHVVRAWPTFVETTAPHWQTAAAKCGEVVVTSE